MRERVKQRGFSRIRVADERDRRQRDRFSPLPLLGANASNFLHLPLDVANAAVDFPAIGFKLRFTWASSADSASKLRHFHAASSQPRQQVLQLRQLHLQLAFTTAGMAGKDVEDELRTIDHPRIHFALNVALLRRR